MSFSGRHDFTRCGKNQFAKRFWEGHDFSRADQCFPLVRPERAQFFKKTRVREGHDVTHCRKTRFAKRFWEGHDFSRADKCFPFVPPERAQLFKKLGFGKGTTSHTAGKLDSRSGFGKGTTSVVPISTSPLCFPGRGSARGESASTKLLGSGLLMRPSRHKIWFMTARTIRPINKEALCHLRTIFT
jgi:hypothetical protein